MSAFPLRQRRTSAFFACRMLAIIAAPRSNNVALGSTPTPSTRALCARRCANTLLAFQSQPAVRRTDSGLRPFAEPRCGSDEWQISNAHIRESRDGVPSDSITIPSRESIRHRSRTGTNRCANNSNVAPMHPLDVIACAARYPDLSPWRPPPRNFHGNENWHPMDRRDVEPDDRVHQDLGGLRSLRRARGGAHQDARSLPPPVPREGDPRRISLICSPQRFWDTRFMVPFSPREPKRV